MLFNDYPLWKKIPITKCINHPAGGDVRINILLLANHMVIAEKCSIEAYDYLSRSESSNLDWTVIRHSQLDLNTHHCLSLAVISEATINQSRIDFITRYLYAVFSKYVCNNLLTKLWNSNDRNMIFFNGTPVYSHCNSFYIHSSRTFIYYVLYLKNIIPEILSFFWNNSVHIEYHGIYSLLVSRENWNMRFHTT